MQIYNAQRAVSALQMTEAQQLISAGLRFTSSTRQLLNGTLQFEGKLGARKVQYCITANGAVISNNFTARRVKARSAAAKYRAGLHAAVELLNKRQR